MAADSIAEIQRGRRDSTDAEILTVYAKVEGLYAIYKTAERVVVHFADDPAMGAQQRQALTPLNPLLGEINGLVDGWRSSPSDKLRAKANIFDRRVADSILLALQGYAAQAVPLLREIKEDLLEERTSPARVDYAVVAAGTALLLIAAAAFFTSSLFRPIYDFTEEGERMWLGFGAGALGGLFFTCTALRTRAILTDLQPWENRVDAIARILIGAIGGALIVALLLSGLLTIAFGSVSIPGQPPTWVKLGIAGFVAGFSERLIPTVMDRAAAAAAGRTGAQTLVGTTGSTTSVSGHQPGERNPLGQIQDGAGDSMATQAPTPAPAPSEPHPDEDVDACVADIDIPDDEQTDDVELPPSTGGVAQAPSG